MALIIFVIATSFYQEKHLFGAPVSNLLRNILPEANDKYDLGTTSPALEWLNVFAKNVTVSGTCTGCGGGSGGVDPFTHPSTNVSATTSGIIISASSTIGNGLQNGGLTVSGGSTTTLNAYFQSPVGINGVSNRGLFGGNGILTVNGDASNGGVFEFFRPISSSQSNVFTFTFGDTSNSVLGQINGRTDTSGSTGMIRFLTSNGSADLERLRVDSQGQTMVGTTSAFAPFTVASSGPQLSLVDGSNTSNAWTIRSIANSLYFATSTNATSATSSVAAMQITPNSQIVFPALQNCNTMDTDANGLISCGTAAGSWSFTPAQYKGVNVQSTTTGLWLNTASIIASSTFFTTASSTVNNGVRYADNYKGATIDAKINNAYADCAAGGVCEIHLNGNYTFSLPLNFNTADKPAKLVCDGGNATKLTYSGSASSTNWNSGLADYGAWGIYGCNLYGQQLGTPDGTVGISLGGSNGARDFVMESTHIVGFGTGIQTEQNTIMAHFSKSLVEYNYRDWDIERANNSGEAFTFDGVTTADCNTGGTSKCFYADLNALTDAVWTSGSFDGAQAYFEDGNSNIVFNGTHWENTAQMRAGSYTGLVTATGGFSSFALNSVEFMNGATTTAKSPVQWILNGANMTMNGVVASQSGGVSATSLINNYGGNGYVSSVGFKNITSTAAGVSIFATSSARFFVDNQNNFTGIATSTNLNGNVLNVNGGMGLNGSFRIYKTTDVSTFTTINFDAATNKVFMSWPLGLDDGGLTVGASYQGLQPPTSGAIIVGKVGVATSSPGSAFSIGTTAGINFSEATSSFSSTGGINLKSGCFAIGGTCMGATPGGTGTELQYRSGASTFGAVSPSSFDSAEGDLMIGTSSPVGQFNIGVVTIGSSTEPQEVWSDNRPGSPLWAVRNSGGTLSFATSTLLATSSWNTLTLYPQGKAIIGLGVPNAITATLQLYEQNGTGQSPSFILGGNTGGDTDYWFGRNSNNDGLDNDTLQIGANSTPGTNPNMTLFNNAKVAFGTTTPGFATVTIGSSTAPQLALVSNNTTDPEWIFRNQNGTLFIATSTLSATSTAHAMTIAPTGFTDFYAPYNPGSITIWNFHSTDNAQMSIVRDGSNSLIRLQAQDNKDRFVYHSTSGSSDSALYFDSDDGGTTRLALLGTGNVGVGSTSPYRTLSVTGTLAVNGLTTFALNDSAVCQRTGGTITVDSGVSSCIVSSKFVKHDINGFSDNEAMNRLSKLFPVTFAYDESNKQDIGLIAEDVAQVDPRYAQYAETPRVMNGHEYKAGDPVAINWNAITADLVKVVQNMHSIKQVATRSAEENWQWAVTVLLFGFIALQQDQIRRLKKVI